VLIVAVERNRFRAVTHALASGDSWRVRPSAVVTAFFVFDGHRTPSVSKWLYRQRGSKDKKLGVTRTSEVAQAKRNKQGCRKDTYPRPLGDDRQAGENWLYRDSRGGRLGWPIDRVKTGQSTLIKSRWQSNTQQPGEGGSTGKRA